MKLDVVSPECCLAINQIDFLGDLFSKLDTSKRVTSFPPRVLPKLLILTSLWCYRLARVEERKEVRLAKV